MTATEMHGVPSPPELAIQVPGWRYDQARVIAESRDALAAYRPVIVEAPPGFGKVVVGVAVARVLGLRSLILTGTKALQRAYGGPPTSIAVVTGRPNHDCVLIPGVKAHEGPCRLGFECPHRYGSCPYFLQRDRGLEADIVVANYAMALSDPMGVLFEDRDLVICDEAHLIESELADHLAIRLSGEMIVFKTLGLPALPSTSTLESLIDWGAAASGLLSDVMERCEQRAGLSGSTINAREAHLFERLRDLHTMVERLSLTDGTWCSQVETDDAGKSTTVIKPTIVAPLAQQVLWSRVPRIMLMSGSVISAHDLVSTIGLDPAMVRVQAEHPTPAANRPIYYRPAARVSHWAYGSELPRLAEAVDTVVEHHSNGGILPTKGIIHTWNWTIARFLSEHCRTRGLFFNHDTADRHEVFSRFRAAVAPAVLLSPSAYYGEDFPGDEARWQIIAKVPYPNLGDHWVGSRRQQDGTWYIRQTVTDLTQTVGRLARGPEDSGITYIFDSNFERLWADVSGWFPAWFHDGLAAARNV